MDNPLHNFLNFSITNLKLSCCHASSEMGLSSKNKERSRKILLSYQSAIFYDLLLTVEVLFLVIVLFGLFEFSISFLSCFGPSFESIHRELQGDWTSGS